MILNRLSSLLMQGPANGTRKWWFIDVKAMKNWIYFRQPTFTYYVNILHESAVRIVRYNVLLKKDWTTPFITETFAYSFVICVNYL